MIIRMIRTRTHFRFVRRVARLMRLLRRSARFFLIGLLAMVGILFMMGSASAASGEKASATGNVRIEICLTTGRSGKYNLTSAVWKVRTIVTMYGGSVLATRDNGSVFVDIQADSLDALLKALEVCGKVERVYSSESNDLGYRCSVIVKIALKASLYETSKTSSTSTANTMSRKPSGSRSSGSFWKTLGKGLGSAGSSAAKGIRRRKKVRENEENKAA